LRLTNTFAKYHDKMCMALPLYGYDWPRPADTTVPKGTSVVISNVADASGQAYWMTEDQELAIRTADGHWVAAPSLAAIHARTQAMMNRGFGRVAFWQLGAGELTRVAQACERADSPPPELRSFEIALGWEDWLLDFKEEVCKKVTAKPGDSLESIGRKYDVPRWKMNRFNENLVATNIDGQTVYVPHAR
ncbi:MAG: LysM peptidoglycan-binding domain-containing protein, partial [Planctomycetota bacterium]